MSGGALGYAFTKIQDTPDDIRRQSSDPMYLAFADHLDKVCTALRSIEWVLSADSSSGDDRDDILACITMSDVIDAAIKRAKNAVSDLNTVIQEAENRHEHD